MYCRNTNVRYKCTNVLNTGNLHFNVTNVIKDKFTFLFSISFTSTLCVTCLLVLCLWHSITVTGLNESRLGRIITNLLLPAITVSWIQPKLRS